MINPNTLTLEQKVAQLFMVGFSGTEPGDIMHRFLRQGVGGIIFFRDNFDGLHPQTALSVKALLDNIRAAIPAGLPRPFFSIDQEGGQVERLPHTLFPTGVTPRSVALSNQPEKLAERLYDSMSKHLSMLGFNMDFFPTLDVNFQHANPIIGVRAFGDTAAEVWPLAKIALETFEENHVATVAKHFPGHGNGTVDSHYELPVLTFTEEELTPFQQAIDQGVPAVLVSHGFYPALQTTPDEQNLPASASPVILQTLLRERCGFQGLVITDDLCMGAITKLYGPVDAALLCLKAGADVLLYKQSTEAEWAVYEAVLEAFRSGRLPMACLDASNRRILALKERLIQPDVSEEEIAHTFDSRRIQTLAEETARAAVSILKQGKALPLKVDQSILLVHPDRSHLGNYAFDVPTSPELPACFEAAGFTNVQAVSYRLHEAPNELSFPVEETPEIILMITFNPLIDAGQVTLFNALRQQFPQSKMIVASAGTPYDADVLQGIDTHLGVCSYRPATMRVLPQFLLNPDSGF